MNTTKYMTLLSCLSTCTLSTVVIKTYKFMYMLVFMLMFMLQGNEHNSDQGHIRGHGNGYRTSQRTDCLLFVPHDNWDEATHRGFHHRPS